MTPEEKAERDAYFESLRVPLDKIYERDKGICWICGQFVPREQASRDHLLPRSLGGRTTWGNIRLAHRSCNSKRGNRAP